MDSFMKGKLDWQKPEVVNIFDEVSLWSAPFTQLMMENIPMQRGQQVLDLGFGTGVPLIELAQRFGDSSQVFGVDLWVAAIQRTREKIRVFDLKNITIFEQSAESIPLPDQSIDLICSNLGVNNFENKLVVLAECYRVLKDDGHLCITTNPAGTFKELFILFDHVMREMKLTDSVSELESYIAHRESLESIESQFAQIGFYTSNIVHDRTHMRFANAAALFNHGLMRIGFLDGWEKLIPDQYQQRFFSRAIELIEIHIAQHGVFTLSIPMLYLDLQKTR